MKGSQFLITTFGILSFLAVFFGFGLMIQNMGRDTFWFVIFLVIFIVGAIGLSIIAFIMMKKNKKK